MIILEDFALITNKKYYSVHTELSALSTELEDIQPGQEHPPVAGTWGKVGCSAGRQFQEQTSGVAGEDWKGPLQLLDHRHDRMKRCHL